MNQLVPDTSVYVIFLSELKTTNEAAAPAAYSPASNKYSFPSVAINITVITSNSPKQIIRNADDRLTLFVPSLNVWAFMFSGAGR